jgi:hypothetical protein
MKNACAALQRKSSEDEEPEGSSLARIATRRAGQREDNVELAKEAKKRSG